MPQETGFPFAALWQALAANTGDFVGVMDATGTAIFMNRSVRGAAQPEVVGRPLEDFLTPERATSVRRLLEGAKRAGAAQTDEAQVITKDGSERWFVERCVQVPAGEGWLYLLVRTETTRLKATEAELRASEVRYRALFESNPDPVLVVLADGRIASSNLAAIQLLGEGLESRRLGELFSAGDRHLATEGAQGQRYSARLLSCFSREFAAEIVESRIEIDGAVARIVVVRDVSERDRLEQQLQIVQKLESMALFAGGVAHDFNNLLTVIASYAEEVRRGASSRVDGAMKYILEATARGTRLNRKLMMFSRKDEQQREECDLAELVVEMEPLLSRALGREVTLNVDLPSRECSLFADRVQLEQVLLNLVVNAGQAIPADATVSDAEVQLRVRTVTVDAAYQQTNAFASRTGQFVELCVSDRGAGMPPALIARIFDPFFTTKPSGTGLGLSVVHGVVEQHGGMIGVQSQLGRGTTFTVLLPTSATEDAPVASAPSRKRLLVVDDEPALLRLTSTHLSELGYDIVTAIDGEEALSLFEVDRNSFDLVVLDLVLPRLSGVEALARMKRLRPDVRALLVSGDPHAEDELERARRGHDASVALLRKPYSTRELAESVRRALLS